jgi:mannose-6-phosphate isomerase-like protein (cupin superfamily)
MIQTINIADKYARFNQHWTPKIVAELNDQQVKLAKLVDDFVWHSHEHEDELFIVFKGTLVMEFRTHTIEAAEGEMIVVPKGVEHFPRTKNGEEVWVMLVEPASTKHTGEVVHEKTQTELEWI